MQPPHGVWLTEASTHPVPTAEDGGGGLQDEHEGELSRLTELLLLVTHDDGQRINQHMRVHHLQVTLLLRTQRERTCDSKWVCVCVCVRKGQNNSGHH